MKKGGLNLLGRKKTSLFDTNIKMKDMDNVEFVLGSSATSESGTASVRARPTVKHHAPSSDSFQGFAVPTPKVPLLPPVNSPQINGSVGGDQLPNGSVMSVPDLEKGEIFVPPPPSMAPPPPPSDFIPPPPDFLGDLNSLDPATIQPPSTPTPNSTSVKPSMQEDLSFLKPPPMAPPKPPSTSSTGSASSLPISNTPPAKIPEHPKFAAPQPPTTERQHKTHKTPPPKPIRLSSVSNLDSPPQTPAPPPPVQRLSTFNPQNTVNLYNVPKTSLLSGLEDPEKKPKQMLLLEDSGSVKSGPVLVQTDRKAPKVATPSKPDYNNVNKLEENLQITQPSELPIPGENKEVKTAQTAQSAQPETAAPLPTPPQKSPQLQKVNSTQMNLEPSKDKPGGNRIPNQKFSPLLDHKLRGLKGSETNGAREGSAASPLALLMAAKEREKHRSTHSLSRENSAKKNEQPSIHPSDIVRSGSSASRTSIEAALPENAKSFSPKQHSQTSHTPENSSSRTLVNDQLPSTNPPLSRIITTPVVSNLAEQRQDAEQSCSKPQSTQPAENKGELNLPLLPPPPEFDDLSKIMELPPSICPPDPPIKKSPTIVSSPSPASVPAPLNKMQPTVSSPSPASVPSPTLNSAPLASVPPPPLKKAPSAPVPPPPLKKTPPASVPPPILKKASPTSVPPPPLNPPPPNVEPKPQIQTKPKPITTQPTQTLDQRHFELQRILKKKFEEMAPKMPHQKEDAEPYSDEWEVNDQVKPSTMNHQYKAATLNMKELQRNLDKKFHNNSSLNASTSNGPKSRHQHGMTFTVRPGTKNPITYYE